MSTITLHKVGQRAFACCFMRKHMITRDGQVELTGPAGKISNAMIWVGNRAIILRTSSSVECTCKKIPALTSEEERLKNLADAHD
jgi:hypothetical protein